MSSTHEGYQLSDRNESGPYGNLISFRTDDDRISRSANTRWIDEEDSNAHCDLISFLAIVQSRELDLMPITWQPGLDVLGEGATAEIRQSQVSLEANFAFKRTKISNSSQQARENETGMFRALVAEISILGHPAIKGHPNIVNLEGICWELGEEEGKVWPVLVFEKAQFGDMVQFMYSRDGQSLSFADKVQLCIDIGTAVMIMHSCRKL
jgi:hypothetical protein